MGRLLSWGDKGWMAVSYMVHLSTMEDENPVFWLKVVWNLRRVVRFWLQPDQDGLISCIKSHK